MNKSLQTIFIAFFKLGCICFGGPIAHLGIFYQEFVKKRQWIDEQSFLDLVALCQSLPGPASSQVAIAIGIKEKGLSGGIIAIIGFLLPSITILMLAAYGMSFLAFKADVAWLQGLKLAVVAIVAQAALSMGKRFCFDGRRIIIAGTVTVIGLFSSSFMSQISAIAIGAIAGKLFLPALQNQKATMAYFSHKIVSNRVAKASWFLFFTILVAVPTINILLQNQTLTIFDSFYQTGSLVFGGGHVILPLLQSRVVLTGWVNSDTFLAGYGLTQALPGPLFSFAAYLGTVIGGISTGFLCIFAIYLPSFLILLGVLPIWERWRQEATFQTILAGISAAVVGLLVAALYDPVCTSTIHSIRDVIFAGSAFILLEFFKWPQWLIVMACLLAAVVF